MKKQPRTATGRSILDKVASKLTDQPRSLAALGADTGYEWSQLLGALRQLRNQGRASPVDGGWVRGARDVVS